MFRTTLAFPFALALTMALPSCAAADPVLYPNAHLEAVGRATAEHDISECQRLAGNYGASGDTDKTADIAESTVKGGGGGGITGAVGGAVLGAPGRGAAVGAATGAAAGFVRELFKPSEPSQLHKSFVERCLRDRGYEPIGWK